MDYISFKQNLAEMRKDFGEDRVKTALFLMAFLALVFISIILSRMSDTNVSYKNRVADPVTGTTTPASVQERSTKLKTPTITFENSTFKKSSTTIHCYDAIHTDGKVNLKFSNSNFLTPCTAIGIGETASGTSIDATNTNFINNQ